MAFQVRVGGEWKSLTAGKIFSGGAWRSIASARIFSGGSWRLVAFPENLSISISPSPFAFSDSSSTVRGTLSATPSGGTAPYAYAWSVVTFNSSLMNEPSFASPTAASTSVSGFVPGHGQSPTATLRCTVTTALGNTATADVSGTFHRT